MIVPPHQEALCKPQALPEQIERHSIRGGYALGTPILMFNGTSKPVETVQVNDLIMGRDGAVRHVLTLHRGQDDMFKIQPLKGKAFTVSRHHILSLVRTNTTTNQAKDNQETIENMAVEDYLKKRSSFKHQLKLYRTRIDFPRGKRLPLDPYFLGILLGDGGLTRSPPNITTSDPEIIEACHDLAERIGLYLRVDQIPDNQANTYHFVKYGTVRNPLSDILRSMNLYGKGAADKHIPHQYKTASRMLRASLLAGLLDTDGYNSKNVIEYSTASKQLADDVAFIARSLGFLALPKIKIVKGRTYYRFCICGDFSEIPLRVGRRIPQKRKQKKNPLRTGFTVHPAGFDRFYNFTLDENPLHIMGDFTVTHSNLNSQ